MPTLSLVNACKGAAIAARPAATVVTKFLLVIEVAGFMDASHLWDCSLLISWQRTGSYVRVLQSHGPFDGPGHHMLKFWLVPVRFHVAHRRVIDAPLAKHLRPGDREVAISAVDILVLHVEFAHVKTHEHAQFIP